MNSQNNTTNIHITGMGVISAIGNTIAETEHSLLNSRPGITPLSLLPTRFKNDFVAGEVKYTNAELADIANIKNTGDSRTLLLSIIALKDAMKSAACFDFEPKKTAFISATTVGGMDKTERHYADFMNGTEKINFIDSHNSGYHSEMIAKRFGFKENIFTINTACSSSAYAIGLGVRLIKSGKCERVVAGGADSLSKYTLNGFHSLMLLDKEPCKPFDKNRKGINLGEGAAYLVLESDESQAKTKNKSLGKIKGYGIANDAFHPTANSVDGKGIGYAMTKAIEMAGLTANDIDYINAHGTATINNDLTEGVAIKRVFNNRLPFFSSTKSFTGHTLATAGALEAIVSVLSIKNKCIFSNLNYSTPIEEHGLAPVSKIIHNISLKNVMSNSIGIGGFCASLILSENQ